MPVMLTCIFFFLFSPYTLCISFCSDCLSLEDKRSDRLFAHMIGNHYPFLYEKTSTEEAAPLLFIEKDVLLNIHSDSIQQIRFLYNVTYLPILIRACLLFNLLLTFCICLSFFARPVFNCFHFPIFILIDLSSISE